MVRHLSTHHELLFRVGAWRGGTHLTAHLHCKDVEAWDLRGASSALNLNAPLARTERFHCAGNGPDFDSNVSHSILACISPGAPGTTYGAKVHIFGPGGAEVDAPLSEIVIDSHHRRKVARGVSLAHRSLSLLADETRILRCTVPV